MADASRKRLDWTVRALEQLETQFEYAVREQLIDAEVLRGRIARTAGLIESHSGIGTPGRSRGTREWPIKGTPLTLIYRVRASSVQILAVLHQRSNFARGRVPR